MNRGGGRGPGGHGPERRMDPRMGHEQDAGITREVEVVEGGMDGIYTE